jgi:hypothetical protein
MSASYLLLQEKIFWETRMVGMFKRAMRTKVLQEVLRAFMGKHFGVLLQILC